MRRVAAILACAALSTLLPAGPLAADPGARTASADANPIHLDPGGGGILTVGDAETRPHGNYRASVTYQTVFAPVAVAPDGGKFDGRTLVTNRHQFDLGFAVGLGERFEFGTMLPVVAHQRAEEPALGLGPTARAGLSRTTTYLAAEVVDSDDGPIGLAAVFTGIWPSSAADAYLGSDRFGAAPSVRLSGGAGPVELTSEVSTTLQSRTAVGTTDVGHRLEVRAGAAYRPTPDWGVSTAFESATRLAAPLDSPDAARAEVLVGGRYRPLPWLELTGAVGRGVVRGVGAPALRGLFSVAYRRPVREPDGPCGYSGRHPPEGLKPDDCPERDFDGDGLMNAEDACPERAEDIDGFEDADGCPDSDNDGDGIPDDGDTCPNHPEDEDQYVDQDGCPDADNDGDGVLDRRDQCPDAAEDFDGFRDADGCPDSDNDNDTVLDTRDACRGTAGPARNDGCPLPGAPEASVENGRIQISEKLYFYTARAILRPRSKDVLEKVAAALRRHPEVRRVEIRGYADRRGTETYNERLSWERAKVIRRYLIHRTGIASDRLVARGYGETGADRTGGSGADPDDLAEKWARARRVEFEILERGEPSAE